MAKEILQTEIISVTLDRIQSINLPPPAGSLIIAFIMPSDPTTHGFGTAAGRPRALSGCGGHMQ